VSEPSLSCSSTLYNTGLSAYDLCGGLERNGGIAVGFITSWLGLGAKMFALPSRSLQITDCLGLAGKGRRDLIPFCNKLYVE